MGPDPAVLLGLTGSIGTQARSLRRTGPFLMWYLSGRLVDHRVGCADRGPGTRIRECGVTREELAAAVESMGGTCPEVSGENAPLRSCAFGRIWRRSVSLRDAGGPQWHYGWRRFVSDARGLNCGARLALANKESLVGRRVGQERDAFRSIVPVDSSTGTGSRRWPGRA